MYYLYLKKQLIYDIINYNDQCISDLFYILEYKIELLMNRRLIEVTNTFKIRKEFKNVRN